MRLLNAITRQLEEFVAEEEIPPYAILSHTWGKAADEVKLQELSDSRVMEKPGYRKIDYCCKQALQDGFQWVWVDTCCIDKTSTAELSEVINSMFRWYKRSNVCYVYLADVSDAALDDPANSLELTKSRWFTRGWTLQELIAPEEMVFFSNMWRSLGTKKELVSLLSGITRVGQEYLLDWTRIRYLGGGDPCIAQIMSWAAERKTTRVEDKAYCLLGLFDVNMPLLYGEGRKSFFRLQEELLKCSSDQSLLAWGIEPPLQQLDPDKSWTVTVKDFLTTGMFARGPEDFRNSSSVRLTSVSSRLTQASPARFGTTPAVVHRGFRAEMPLLKIPHLTGLSSIQDSGPRLIQQIITAEPKELCFAMIQYYVQGNESHLLGIPIVKLSIRNPLRAGYPSYGRCQPLVLIPLNAFVQLEFAHTLLHVDGHWLYDWCFNKPLFPTFWTPETDGLAVENAAMDAVLAKAWDILESIDCEFPPEHDEGDSGPPEVSQSNPNQSIELERVWRKVEKVRIRILNRQKSKTS